MTMTTLKTNSWWVTSLAISVTCCAIMFVIFAGYLADIHKELQAQDAKIEQMADQQNLLLSEIDALRHPATDTGAPAAATDTAVPKIEAPDVPANAIPQPPAEAPMVTPEAPAKH